MKYISPGQPADTSHSSTQSTQSTQSDSAWSFSDTAKHRYPKLTEAIKKINFWAQKGYNNLDMLQLMQKYLEYRRLELEMEPAEKKNPKKSPDITQNPEISDPKMTA